MHQLALSFDYCNNTTSLSQKKSANTRKKRFRFTHNLKVEMQMMLAYHFGFPGHACLQPAPGKCEIGGVNSASPTAGPGAGSDSGTLEELLGSC